MPIQHSGGIPLLKDEGFFQRHPNLVIFVCGLPCYLWRIVAHCLRIAGLQRDLLAVLLVSVVPRLAHRLVDLCALLVGLAVLHNMHGDKGCCRQDVVF